MKLAYSYDVNVECAYIITMKGNELSERESKRCQDSCAAVGQPFRVWDAFTTDSKSTIFVPEQVKADTFMDMIKLTDYGLSLKEAACALSHVSLWSHCVRVGRPIIVLEHDAVMVERVDTIEALNSVIHLGGPEWGRDVQMPRLPIPPMWSSGHNLRYLGGAYAYAIDPMAAKNLCARVLDQGVYAAADSMVRADYVNLSQQGYKATFILERVTTIDDRDPKLKPVLGPAFRVK